MAGKLKVAIGQHSDKGHKALNQDFHGAYVPREPQLSTKGVALALADGISSSTVSQIASESAVAGFLADYYCTSEAWSVKKSAGRVLTALNSWLHAQTRHSQFRYDMDKGYVCTLSALIVKATTAHLFHVGDSRIFRLVDGTLEQLTRDHRIQVSRDQSYLSRAMGANPQLELDYQAVPVEEGTIFILATDGIHEFVSPSSMAELAGEHHDLDEAARRIVAEALARGSDDNLTLQILRIEELPTQEATEIAELLGELCLPPLLQARMNFEGYTILRELHGSSRSHVYLARDEAGRPVAIKTPSIALSEDPAYLERFLLEEWIARRLDSPYVVKALPHPGRKRHVYTVMEYIEGQTLSQWMIDNPSPDLETVRRIVEQIAKGIRAFHRLEMLHQDIRPDNILIDASGSVKIIDFGATRVAGLRERRPLGWEDERLGTAQYSAPEYFLGEPGTNQSDLFSLAVIAYQLLGGKLPYGTAVASTRSPSVQARLRYRPIAAERNLPHWIDPVLRKALHPQPAKRYQALSEFLYDLRHPGLTLLEQVRPPLLERRPLLFWQSLCLVLTLVILALLVPL